MLQQVVLLHKNAYLCKLPKDVPDPLLHFQRMKVATDGEEADVLVAYDKYKLWGSSADTRVRWAEISWPDDGLGICAHGAGKNLVEAIISCFKHKRLREQLQGT